jgi:phosphoribosylaminoimidazole-succinocarboxamide synthase
MVECVVRGYITGSGWSAYQREGAILDVQLPPGLVEGDRLPEPIFTPTTKTPPEEGHDEPLTFAQVVDQVGRETAERLRDLTIELYRRGAAITEERGVLLVDTKFEFGFTPDDELLLADEVLTLDSSRYWRVEDWKPGGPQTAWDKQYVRDWASSLDWDKTPPGPEVPPDVVAETRRRYIAMYERITGQVPLPV